MRRSFQSRLAQLFLLLFLANTAVSIVAAQGVKLSVPTKAAQPGKASQAAKQRVEISGEQAWLDTGIELNPGDRLVITGSGQMRYADARTPAGPNGLARAWRDLLRALPVRDAGRGALIGRIGDGASATPFLIAERREMDAPVRGRLFIGINTLANNRPTGKFTVEIEVSAAAKTAGVAAPIFHEAREVGTVAGITTDLFNKVPRRVADPDGTPGDMVNFALIGSEDDVTRALAAAGWVKVDRTNKEAVLRGVLASISKQAYVEMPMSILHLFDRPQDFGFAHAEPLAVVAQRHHFRLWRAPFTANGETVWIGAGTHDVGFDRDERNGRVTHKIDPNVDGEREFIRESLAATGMVAEFSYVTPRDPVRNARTAHGQDFQSDGRVLILRLPGFGLDRARLFGEIFCGVLAQQTDTAQWGACSQYIESPGEAAKQLAPVPADYRVLIVPGVMNSCAASTPAFQEGHKYLREKYGIPVDLLAVPNESSETNAKEIAEWIESQSRADSRKFIVIGYSKGGPDLQTMLALYPQAAERVAAFVSVAGAIGGSPIADAMPAIADRWMSMANVGTCRGNMSEAFKSLRRDVRQAFLRQYPSPRVPSYTITATSTLENTSKMLRQTWELLAAYDTRQDGQLTRTDATIPQSLFLGTVFADHFAVALPLADDPNFKTMADRNRYPRTALLESIVRFVAQDLASKQSSEKK